MRSRSYNDETRRRTAVSVSAMRLALIAVVAVSVPARADSGWIWEVAARAFAEAGNDKTSTRAAMLAWWDRADLLYNAGGLLRACG